MSYSGSKYYTPLSTMSSRVTKSNSNNSSKYYTPLSRDSKSITSKNLFITDKRIEKNQKLFHILTRELSNESHIISY